MKTLDHGVNGEIAGSYCIVRVLHALVPFLDVV
jgi:hypothetical protein